MSLHRMDNVLIVVDDLAAAKRSLSSSVWSWRARCHLRDVGWILSMGLRTFNARSRPCEPRTATVDLS